jgi:hypothetical protein
MEKARITLRLHTDSCRLGLQRLGAMRFLSTD